MGRPPVLKALLGAVLIGSAALAQQGLIVEPWRAAPTPASSPLPVRALVGPGLVSAVPPAPRVVVSRQAPLVEPAAAATATRWSPPVIELLVDPWGEGQVVAPPARPHWVPPAAEIVDPWADDTAAEPPRVASHPAGARHATIF